MNKLYVYKYIHKILPDSFKDLIGYFYSLLDEDGNILYTHFCSNDTYAHADLVFDRLERVEELNSIYGIYNWYVLPEIFVKEV